MTMITLILFVFIAITQAQKLLSLKSLNGDNAENFIFNGTTAIYATATMDDMDYLKKIFITSTISGTYSVFNLTQQKFGTASDQLDPWIAKGVTTVTTSLSSIELNLLTGTIYYTSESQAKNQLFRVYDISQIQTVRIDSRPNNVETTAVFLNSRFLGYHMQSTTFSDWSQEAGISAKIFQNIPSDVPEVSGTQIFSNPILIGTNYTFIPTPEDFSITLGAFYMKVSGTGSFIFRTTPAYNEIDGSQTNFVTSTGFYMKSFSESERFIRVNLLNDPNFEQFSGFNSIANIPKNGNVSVSIANSYTDVYTTFNQSNAIVGWTTNFVGDNFGILPKNTNGGQFFIQYFTIQGQRSKDPVTVPTSATTIETSTKSAGKLNLIIPLFISIISVVMLKNHQE